MPVVRSFACFPTYKMSRGWHGGRYGKLSYRRRYNRAWFPVTYTVPWLTGTSATDSRSSGQGRGSWRGSAAGVTSHGTLKLRSTRDWAFPSGGRRGLGKSKERRCRGMEGVGEGDLRPAKPDQLVGFVQGRLPSESRRSQTLCGLGRGRQCTVITRRNRVAPSTWPLEASCRFRGQLVPFDGRDVPADVLIL